MFWTNALGATSQSWRVKADFPRNHVKEKPGGLSENQIKKAVWKGRGECLQGERDTCEEVKVKGLPAPQSLSLIIGTMKRGEKADR